MGGSVTVSGQLMVFCSAGNALDILTGGILRCLGAIAEVEGTAVTVEPWRCEMGVIQGVGLSSVQSRVTRRVAPLSSARGAAEVSQPTRASFPIFCPSIRLFK